MAFNARLLNGIGVLVAVVEAGSFVRAAQTLGMTQSGVSRSIARLEERVNVRLLQRTPRAVTLTAEGRVFYEKVSPLLTSIEDAAGEASDTAVTPKGRLRVGMDPQVSRLLMGPRAKDFLQAYPELSLDMVARDELGDMIAEGFDAAIRFGEPGASAVVARKLLDSRVVTCASRSYLEAHGTPKEPRDLVKHECIMFRNPVTGRPYRWRFIRGAKRVTIKTTGRLFVNDGSALIASCIAGHGIAQTIEVALRSIENHGLEQLLTNWPDQTFPLYVYYPSRHQPPAKVRALIDFVVAAARI